MWQSLVLIAAATLREIFAEYSSPQWTGIPNCLLEWLVLNVDKHAACKIVVSYFYLHDLMTVQETLEVETLVKGKLRESDPVPRNIPVILPDKLLTYLFNDLGLEIPQDAVEQYWKHAKDVNYPWSNASDGSHIPCAIYGDSAKFSLPGEKITCVFFSLPLWNPRSARLRIWLLFALETYRIQGGLTMNPLYRVIVESMTKLYHDGIQVGEKILRFVITELKGDWEWHEFSLGLTRSWRSHKFCWRCEASKNIEHGTSYLDFNDHPCWEFTELSQVQFLARCFDSSRPGGTCALDRPVLLVDFFCICTCLITFFC